MNPVEIEPGYNLELVLVQTRVALLNNHVPAGIIQLDLSDIAIASKERIKAVAYSTRPTETDHVTWRGKFLSFI